MGATPKQAGPVTEEAEEIVKNVLPGTKVFMNGM